MRHTASRWARCLALAALVSAAGARADTYFVNVAGLGGEPDYEQRFTTQAADLDRIAKGTGATTHVVTLSGAQATRDQLQQTLSDIAGQAHADDVLVITLVGHGSLMARSTSSIYRAQMSPPNSSPAGAIALPPRGS